MKPDYELSWPEHRIKEVQFSEDIRFYGTAHLYAKQFPRRSASRKMS